VYFGGCVGVSLAWCSFAFACFLMFLDRTLGLSCKYLYLFVVLLCRVCQLDLFSFCLVHCLVVCSSLAMCCV
jgi:hypothetical protein